MSNQFQNLAPSNRHLTRRIKTETKELSNEGDPANKSKNISHKITVAAAWMLQCSWFEPSFLYS